MLAKNASKAASPPAEAPIPTMRGGLSADCWTFESDIDHFLEDRDERRLLG
jgi:hypothetical protein